MPRASAHGRSFRHGNLFYNVARVADGEPLVRMVQWPSYHQPMLNRVRLDTRIAELLEPLIGRNLKQIINQIHWKAPGSLGDFAWHQDSKSRRPASAYRNLATFLCADGPRDRSAHPGIRVPALHSRQPPPRRSADELRDPLAWGRDEGRCARSGRPFSGRCDRPAARPGDFVLWSPYLVHGSGTNRSDHKRRFYINGYVRAEDCDRGEWAFRNGRPVPFGPKPALVHYEELLERPGPHYV